MKQDLKVAIVQAGPAYLDLERCLAKMTELVHTAASSGAEMIVFGETWLSGYPAWLDHCPDYARWDHEPTKTVFARMYQNSITVPGPATEHIAALARQHRMVICTGINEVVHRGAGNGTIYNALLIFDADGSLRNHHRKLMPTYTEKLLYGLGDGHGLQAVDTVAGRLGSLICWEHWMPLTRQTLHRSGEEIHLALWPQVHEMLQVASRHYAFEGRCYVIAVGQLMRAADFPAELALPEHLSADPQQLVLHGGSCIYGPNGAELLSPQWDGDELLYYTFSDTDRILKERMTLDTSGHYQRPDIFQFDWNKDRR